MVNEGTTYLLAQDGGEVSEYVPLQEKAGSGAAPACRDAISGELRFQNPEGAKINLSALKQLPNGDKLVHSSVNLADGSKFDCDVVLPGRISPLAPQ